MQIFLPGIILLFLSIFTILAAASKSNIPDIASEEKKMGLTSALDPFHNGNKMTKDSFSQLFFELPTEYTKACSFLREERWEMEVPMPPLSIKTERLEDIIAQKNHRSKLPSLKEKKVLKTKNEFNESSGETTEEKAKEPSGESLQEEQEEKSEKDSEESSEETSEISSEEEH
jgi:hypothetical protein